MKQDTELSFTARLGNAWRTHDSLLCVGLDPDPTRFPQALARDRGAIFDFNRAIVDATCDLVCAFKPQFAHYASVGAETALERTIAYIHDTCPGLPVILDAKRGDIGSTAEHYAREAFERYGADAVTVNPYLGRDSVEPFLRYRDRGVIVLCRTSNPGAGEFQEQLIDGRPLYRVVAERVAREWNTRGNCALVVGATYPEQLAEVRAVAADMPILVPGVGAQGGDARQVVASGAAPDGTGLVISSSRSVLYAGSGDDFADAARRAALALRDEINAGRP